MKFLILLYSIGLTLSCANLTPTLKYRSPIIKYEKAHFSPEERKVVQWLSGQEDHMLKLLKDLVLINSGSGNKEGLNQVRKRLAKELQSLGFKTETLLGGEMDILSCKSKKFKFADHLVATLRGNSGKRLLLSGHMDTVFSKGHSFNEITFDGDLIKGPGVSDMKGGLVVMIYALKALHQLGHLKDRHITVILNSDEEVGSLSSRPYIENLAKVHDFGLVFEGTYKNRHPRARKGLGQIRLLTRGRASHAGASHKRGLSAIKEIAHKIIEIEKLTDYEKNITLNVGLVNGGDARNTIPPCADAYIDLRYKDTKQARRVIQKIKAIAHQPHTENKFLKAQPKTKMWSILHRPAKPQMDQTDQMLSMYLGISLANGISAHSAYYPSGGTDGSIMQYIGLPTVDSLGVDGSGSHSIREQARKSSFVPRAQSAAVYMMKLFE